MREEIDVKKELLTILDFYKYKLSNDGCTVSEMRSVGNMLAENLNVEGTAKDFANFYGVSEENVRHILNRYVIDKPKRRVFYKFHKFAKCVPIKWVNNRQV